MIECFVSILHNQNFTHFTNPFQLAVYASIFGETNLWTEIMTGRYLLLTMCTITRTPETTSITQKSTTTMPITTATLQIFQIESTEPTKMKAKSVRFQKANYQNMPRKNVSQRAIVLPLNRKWFGCFKFFSLFRADFLCDLLLFTICITLNSGPKCIVMRRMNFIFCCVRPACVYGYLICLICMVCRIFGHIGNRWVNEWLWLFIFSLHHIVSQIFS